MTSILWRHSVRTTCEKISPEDSQWIVDYRTQHLSNEPTRPDFSRKLECLMASWADIDWLVPEFIFRMENACTRRVDAMFHKSDKSDTVMIYLFWDKAHWSILRGTIEPHMLIFASLWNTVWFYLQSQCLKLRAESNLHLSECSRKNRSNHRATYRISFRLSWYSNRWSAFGCIWYHRIEYTDYRHQQKKGQFHGNNVKVIGLKGKGSKH